MNDVYGVSVNGVYTDVSRTERGAKNYATRHGFTVVYCRFNCGYNIAAIAEKTNNNWQSIQA